MYFKQLVIIILSVSLIFSCTKEKPEERPNIILILIDDMGWKDFGEAGSSFYETPNIDKLSREGIRFTLGYSAAPVCSPSRGALLTGKYPGRTKFTTVWDNYETPIDKDAKLHSVAKMKEKERRSRYNYRFDEGLHYHSLPLTETTFANILSENGYLTGFIGKWHCGWNEKFWPHKRGFNYAEGFRKVPSGTPHFGVNAVGKIAGMEDLRPDDHIGDKLTDKAVRFINDNSNSDKPFMLMLSHYLVHGPLEAKSTYIEAYKDKPATDQENPVYAAMIQSVDESVGRILQALSENGIEKNTVVIFTSDNGGLVPNTSNYPLLGGKSFIFEAGTRVPFIVRWKDNIEPAVDTKHRIIQTDIFPTLLEIAGIEQMPELHKDGKSFYPLLMNKGGWSQHPLFFHFPHYTHATSPVTSLIDNDWKLVRFYNNDEEDQYMLFNLKDDPYELIDMAGIKKEMLEKMARQMQQLLIETEGENPILNPNFDNSKPGQLNKDHYYNFAITQRNEREKALQNERQNSKSANPYGISEEKVQWMKEATINQLGGCRIKGAGDTWIHTPDGVGNYKALWTRDFYYMVEYAGDLMDPDEIKASINYLLNGQREDGCIPDRVNVAGEPVYSPGPPGKPMADNALDNGPFMAMLVCSYVNQYKDESLFRRVEQQLNRGLNHTAIGESGLVFNNPENPQCVYGFTDIVKKTGNLLFSSLLYYKANLEMYQLCKKLECGTPEIYKSRYEKIQKNIDHLWDEDNGMFWAADIDCRQPDIWGSAYAVAVGITSDKQSDQIAEYLVEHYDETVMHGQVRHLTLGEGSWNKLFKPCDEGTYQNGAYWATPLAWVIPVFARSDPGMARKMLESVITDFQENGINECINHGYEKVPNFVVSATNVYYLTR